MKKAMLIISILSVIFGSCACSPINNSTTNSAESSVVETTSPENNENDTEISTTEETIETNVFSNDGSEIIVDTDKSNVEISETSDGTKVATVKTDDGKEVKVAVKEDESGKTVVDTSKVINDEGQVENSADSSKNKTEVKVNDDGKVTIKTEVSVPVETSKNNSTNSKPSETSKKTTENSKSSDTSKTAETSKSSESSNTKTTPTKKIAAETEESSSNIEAKSISLNKSSLTLKAGETATLTATINPSNATDKTVHWKSTNSSIVTVNNGKITAIKEGNATITASTSCNCKEAICKVTVKANSTIVNVSSITLNKTSITLEEGKTTILTATINPSNATNKNVTWSSNNTNVATVNNGTIKANKAGTATITAISNNGKSASCKITVKAKEQPKPSTVEVTSITLNKTNVTLEKGKTTTLTATVNPSNATNKNITWSSNNTNVATVNNGTITAKKAGTANIIAKSNNGKTATCKVTVKAKNVIANRIDIDGNVVINANTTTNSILVWVYPGNVDLSTFKVTFKNNTDNMMSFVKYEDADIEKTNEKMLLRVYFSAKTAKRTKDYIVTATISCGNASADTTIYVNCEKDESVKAYYAPFNIDQIVKDMRKYGESHGMTWDDSKYVKFNDKTDPAHQKPITNSSFFIPMDSRVTGLELKQQLLDSVLWPYELNKEYDPWLKIEEISFKIVPLYNSYRDYWEFYVLY